MNKEYKNIILTDEGLKAINAPEFKHFEDPEESKDVYQRRLKQAINEGMDFKPENLRAVQQRFLNQEDEEELSDQYGLFINNYYHSLIEKGKSYPIPDGYEVRVEEDVKHPLYGNGLPECQYAILVPKGNLVTKEMQDKMNADLIEIAKQPLFKQQSIEEAAEAYIDKWNGGDILSSIENAYIAGAKSQAAKEYWYEIFKTEASKP